jgi:arylformamidase
MNNNPLQKRVVFDFEVDFSNGGGIQGQDFRLDIDGDDIGDEALAAYIVQDMRLLMVGAVRILNKHIISEPHKRVSTSTETLETEFKLIDLSHTIEEGMITYKGLPAPIICDFLSREASRKIYAPGTEFHIGKIEMVANTGTYLDSPFHRYANGKDLSDLDLKAVANLDGVIVHVTNRTERAITKSVFAGLDLRGKALLVHTGWDQHWRTDQYFEGHPFLTAEAAAYLVEAGVALVGIDSLNIDDISGGERPVHSTLLGQEILIVEHLCNLDQIPTVPFRFYAVPVKVKSFGTFPVRAFARIET